MQDTWHQQSGADPLWPWLLCYEQPKNSSWRQAGPPPTLLPLGEGPTVMLWVAVRAPRHAHKHGLSPRLLSPRLQARGTVTHPARLTWLGHGDLQSESDILETTHS